MSRFLRELSSNISFASVAIGTITPLLILVLVERNRRRIFSGLIYYLRTVFLITLLMVPHLTTMRAVVRDKFLTISIGAYVTFQTTVPVVVYLENSMDRYASEILRKAPRPSRLRKNAPEFEHRKRMLYCQNHIRIGCKYCEYR